jgi:hypothetical protein
MTKKKTDTKKRHAKLSQTAVLGHFIKWNKENPHGSWSEYHKSAAQSPDKGGLGRNKVSTSKVHKNRLYNINQRLKDEGYETLKLPVNAPTFRRVALELGIKKAKKKK